MRIIQPVLRLDRLAKDHTNTNAKNEADIEVKGKTNAETSAQLFAFGETARWTALPPLARAVLSLSQPDTEQKLDSALVSALALAAFEPAALAPARHALAAVMQTAIGDACLELRFRVMAGFAGTPVVVPLAVRSSFESPKYSQFARVAWSPDARLLAVSAPDGSVRVLLVLAPAIVVPILLIARNSESLSQTTIPFFNPLAALFFLSLAESSEYRIITIGMTGELRCFSIDSSLVEVASGFSTVATNNPATFWRNALVRIAADGSPLPKFEATVSSGSHVRLIHVVLLGQIVKLVSWAESCANGSFIFAGLASKDLKQCIFIAESILESPYYRVSSGDLNKNSFSNILEVPKSSEINSLRGSSLFERIEDLITDIFVHTFNSIKATSLGLYKQAIVKGSVSPSKSRLISIDIDGTLYIHELRDTLNFTHRYNYADLASYRLALSLIDSETKSITEPMQLLSANWWSETAIVLLFSDGFLCISSVPLKSQTPPIHVSFFSPLSSIAVLPESQIFVLEDSASLHITNRKISTILSTITNPPSQSLAGLLRTIQSSSKNAGGNNTFLSTILSVTPEEAVQMRAALKDYEAAFQLCTTFGLSRDIVYKRMFLESHEKGANESTWKLLDKVVDDDWVIETCFHGLHGPGASELRAAFRTVIKRSEYLTLEEVEREVEEAFDETIPNGEDFEGKKPVSKMDLCLHRVRAFKYLDRLDLFEAILETGVSPVVVYDGTLNSKKQSFEELFLQFRDMDLVYLACIHAAQGNIDVLKIMFSRHSKDILPHRFTVLAKLPISFDLTSSVVEKILPKCDPVSGDEISSVSRPWRKPDWTEASHSIQDLVHEFAENEPQIFSNLKKNIVAIPASAPIVSKWYINRALNIEDKLGDTKMAIDLLEFASNSNVENLEPLINEFTTLFDLSESYEGKHGGGKLTLSDIREMPVDTIVKMMLAGVRNHPDLFCNRVKDSVVPFLNRVAADGQVSLDAYLLTLAQKHIKSCAKVFERSRTGIPLDDRVIVRSDEDFARLILGCAYSMEPSDDMMEVLYSLLGSLPQITNNMETDGWEDDFNSTNFLNDENTSTLTNLSLPARISLFESHLETIELLKKYKINVTLQYLTSSEFVSPANKRLLAIKMARSFSQNEEVITSDDEFLALAEDLSYLLKLNVFLSIDGNNVKKEFVKAILQKGRFSLAKKLLDSESPIVDGQTSESLVVECARELYDNSESGDMHRGVMKLAVDCLKVIKPTPSTLTELRLIDATHQIHRLSQSLQVAPPFPIQIRLNSNRMDIISSLVYNSNSPKSIDMKMLLDIGRKLNGIDGISSEQRRIDMQVRAIVANWALDRQEFKYAVKVCEDMMGSVLSEVARAGTDIQTAPSLQRSDEIWLVCVRLIKEVGVMFGVEDDATLDSSFQKRLIGFILERCEPSGMVKVLDLIRRANIAESLQQEGDLNSLNYSDSLNYVHGLLVELPTSSKGSSLGGIDSDGRLTRNDFYAVSQNQLARGGSYLFDNIVHKSEKKELIELYLNLHFVSSCRSAFERRRDQKIEQIDDSNKDMFLISLAQEYFKSGEIETALAILLDVEDGFLVKDFFDSIKPSHSTDLLAVFFFSLRCISNLVVESKRSELTRKLLNLSVVQLFKYVDSSAIRKAVMQCGPDSVSFEALQQAVSFSSRTKSSHSDEVLQAVISRTGCSAEEFFGDEAYRKQTIISMTHQINESGLLNDILAISESLGLNSSILVFEHISWLFKSSNASADILQSGLIEFGGLIVDENTPDLCKLKLDVVETKDVRKQILFYSFLAHQYGKNISLDDIIHTNYESITDLFTLYKGILENDQSLHGFLELVQYLPRFRELILLDIFLDEAELLEKYQYCGIDNKDLMYALGDLIADSKKENIEFEDQDENLTERDFREMSILAEFISIEKILTVTYLYLVGEQIDAIMAHLNLIEKLEKLKDPGSSVLSRIYDQEGEVMQIERIQQFDDLYEGDIVEYLILCLKMVIAGSSPYIVSETCKLFQSRFPSSREKFEIRKIYSDAVLLVLGVNSHSELFKAFRKDVEPAIDALHRLVVALVEYIPGIKDNSSMKPKNGWNETEDEEEWDNEDNNVFGDDNTREITTLISSVKFEVREAIVRVISEKKETVSSNLKLDLIAILKKHFGYENIDASKVQLAKLDSIVRSTWDFESNQQIHENDTAEPKLFVALFENLLKITTNANQCDGLFALVSALEENFLDENTFLKCQVDNVESQILKILATQNTENSHIEWLKYSLLSQNSQIALTACASLLESANTSQQPRAEGDRALFLLAVVNGQTCALAHTNFWSNMVNALTTRGSIANWRVIVSMHERILNRAVLDLIIGGMYLAAFEVVVLAFKIPTDLLGGHGVRYGVLKGYLRRIAGGGEHVSAQVAKNENTNDDGWNRFMNSVEEVSNLRSRSNGNMSEGERVLEALKKLQEVFS
ncbi:hypothetical protein HK100_000355 [Physocladia obscura]|uniref:Sec39 domain-containing protein n=1 Tax=Physocladia obscura TaxID=109957 RepID=A0AAD5T8T9_9FUNG|nr:hypothetical protein HK100_000355 [Physocladia obscura]